MLGVDDGEFLRVAPNRVFEGIQSLQEGENVVSPVGDCFFCQFALLDSFEHHVLFPPTRGPWHLKMHASVDRLGR